MKISKSGSENGVSLIEILIVIVIIAVIAAFATGQFGSSKTQMQRQNIAREFKVNLERCRFDSVRRRASTYAEMARIVFKSASSYDVMFDSNQDGVISSGETRSIDFTSTRDVRIIMPTTSFPVTIRFDQRGFVASDNYGNRISPLFTVCNGVCDLSSTITPANANTISISPTGTVSMLFGGDVIPPLTAPSVSTLSATSGVVNPWMTVMPTTPVTPTPNPTPTPSPGSTATPTPTQTPIATPTPTATPVSTPTPTSTPLPTPTPSPTPNICSLNQRPSQTGCTCQLPFTVRSNGKCY